MVDHERVSRAHADLRVCAGGLRVTDRNSRNGTFVEGCRVGTAVVAPGQLVKFGSVTFRFEIHDPADDDEEEETDPINATSGPAPSPTITLPDGLTPARARVLRELLTGESPKRIARKLGLKYNTVRSHMKALYRFFDVKALPQLLAAVFNSTKR